MRELYFVTTAAAALLAAHPAAGQTAPPPADQAQPALAEDQLADIVVTAQKVENNVQRVPIAVQTISGDALLKSGVQSAQDLQRFVPGLSVSSTGAGGSSFYIRGVGNVNESPNTDSGLAISLDQAFFSRAYGPDIALYDLERVEVLKGPQGTLYGRNATAGTVNIISRKPVLGETAGNLAFEVGNYAALKVNGAYNLALGSTVALRAAFQVNKHDGYLKDGYDDANTKAVRVHLLWRPSPTVSLLVSADYMNNDSNGPGVVPYNNHKFLTADPYEGGASAGVRAFVVSRNPGTAVGLPANVSYPVGGCAPGCLPANFGPTVTPGPWQVETNGFTDINVKSVKAVLDVDMGFAMLTVIPAYLHTDFEDKYFKGSTPVYNYSVINQETIEARLASPTGRRFSWIAGLFYFHEKQAYTTVNASTGPTAITYTFTPDFQTRSKAAFAQASFELVDSLKLTGGIRRTIDEKSSANAISGSVNYVPGPTPVQTQTALSSNRFTSNTFRVGLDWQVRRSNLFYGYVATGFHAGGFNIGFPVTRRLCTPNPAAATLADFAGCDAPFDYKPETLTAYAIGTKNRFFGNRVQLNVEAYYWRYKDLQFTHLGVINQSVSGLRTDNAGSATIKGVDVEASWLATPDDLIAVNANYNDSRYGDLLYYNVTFGRSVTTSNLTGRPFLNAPRFVTTFAYQHSFHLANGGRIIPAVNGKYQTGVTYGYLPAGQTTDVYQNPYVKFDLNLNYAAPDDGYNVGLFVRNATDKTTLLAASGGNTPGTSSPWTSLAPPRTYGVNFRARF